MPGQIQRPYVTDKLLLIYHCATRLQVRLAFLVSEGLNKNRPINWKKDHMLQTIALEVIPLDMWEHTTNQEPGGFAQLLAIVEQEMVKEVRNNLYGLGQFSEILDQATNIAHNAEAKHLFGGP